MNEAHYLIEGNGMPPMPVDLVTLRDYFLRGDLGSVTVRNSETGRVLTQEQIRDLLQIITSVKVPPIAHPSGQWAAPPSPADLRSQHTHSPRGIVDGNQDPMRFVAPIHTSGWAIAASYLGLFSVLLVFAPFSILAGIKALQDIKTNPHKTGKGRAIFGLVMGVFCTLILGIVIIAAIVSPKR